VLEAYGSRSYRWDPAGDLEAVEDLGAVRLSDGRNDAGAAGCWERARRPMPRSRRQEISIAAGVFLVSQAALHVYWALQFEHGRDAVPYVLFQLVATMGAIWVITNVERWSRPKSHERMILMPQMLVLAIGPAAGSLISLQVAMALVPRVMILPVADLAWIAVAFTITLSTCVTAILRTGQPQSGQG
jgi:hypothetical protein